MPKLRQEQHNRHASGNFSKKSSTTLSGAEEKELFRLDTIPFRSWSKKDQQTYSDLMKKWDRIYGN